MELKNVGAQLYTLHGMLKTPEEIAKTLPKVREIGYEVVQVSGVGPIEPAELRKILDGCGLSCCATHEPTDKILHETDQVIEKLKIIGAPTTGIGSVGPEYYSEEGYKRLAAEASEAGRKMKEAGITLMYHNHSFEFQKYGGKTGLAILFDESDPRYLQAEPDTYWIQHGGASPAAWCRKLKGRIPVIHLKDMAIVAGQQTIAEIGAGNIDFKEIRDICDEGGTQWYVVEQDTCPGSPLDSLKQSYDYIKEELCT